MTQYAVPPTTRAGRRWLGHGVAIVILSVAACSGDPYLAALEADPMASYEAEELELFNVIRQRRAGPQLITGGFTLPLHVRQFEVDQSEAAEALAEAVDFAEISGWVPEGHLMPEPSREEYVAMKELSLGVGLIVLKVDRNPDEFDDPDVAVLTINLSYSGFYDQGER